MSKYRQFIETLINWKAGDADPLELEQLVSPWDLDEIRNEVEDLNDQVESLGDGLNNAKEKIRDLEISKTHLKGEIERYEEAGYLGYRNRNGGDIDRRIIPYLTAVEFSFEDLEAVEALLKQFCGEALSTGHLIKP